jgi:hypothetical protein
MSIRGLLLDTLREDAGVIAILPALQIHGSRATDEQIVLRPFAVVRFAGTFPGISRIKQTRAEIMVHDNEGSYTRIDNAIKAIKNVLDNVVQLKHDTSDTWLIEAAWESDSVDLFDDGYRTNMKSTTYTLTGTGF